MLPVFESPKVRLCFEVVANVPLELRYAPAPFSPPEIDATGVPVLRFSTANLALVVACPPISKSVVELIGNSAPLLTDHQLVESPNVQLPQVGAPLAGFPAVKH